jgi:hypothetical protein
MAGIFLHVGQKDYENFYRFFHGILYSARQAVNIFYTGARISTNTGRKRKE